MTDNGTFFEASNGWQFRVNENGRMEYKFQDGKNWVHFGTQVGLGFIEWAQSEIWEPKELA